MTGRQATRMRQKYKDSCTHCAGAKVRCSKEKPRCNRCHERGLECSYGLSYRYGRLPARAKLGASGYIDQAAMKNPSVPRELIPSGSRTPSPTSEPTTMQMSWLSESNMNMLNANTSAINGFANINYHDPHTPTNFMGHTYDTSTAPLAPIATQAYQALTPTSDPITTAATFNTINYIPCLDSLNQPAPRRHHSRSVSSASSMPSGYDYNTGTFSNASPVAFGTPPETPRARPVQNYASNLQHDCLSQAAATLLSLRHDPTSSPGGNQEMMDYILQMVDCDCFAHDSHVRMFVVLIGFQVMDRYSKTTQNMTLVNTEGVFEELQVVLKFIERLLRRLRETGTGDYAQGLAPSFAVFGQLEADLRKHLRGISHNTLRRV
ncbi:hypothetical protein NPX13_g930 [Xylaria arbuscula]|uniref:Zn(2)-C6 fungal-type domain-containing protein n=1 Tax=Xylaria arbuscula TaxID=114810 RepID=A0A9W8TQ33_9PEZI|nr:hypothetical protein NPX13_g930 [Xylaria arbuscula]